jgi:hypothetical protein
MKEEARRHGSQFNLSNNMAIGSRLWVTINIARHLVQKGPEFAALEGYRRIPGLLKGKAGLFRPQNHWARWRRLAFFPLSLSHRMSMTV